MRLSETSKYTSHEDEIAKLLGVLRETGRRLEELTGGEVDTAADADGRVLLLRGTHEQLKNNQLTRQAAILNALPLQIALLDVDGTIISVNECWRGFAEENQLGGDPRQGLGVNYLTACDNVTGPGARDAQFAAAGIRSVLSGTSESFSFDYECDSRRGRRWFELTVTPLVEGFSHGVIVKHADITASRRDQFNVFSLAERLSLATAIAKVGVWEWDLASDVLTWDETMYAIYGFPLGTPMTYKTWAATLHPEDLPEAEARLQRTIHERSEEKAEFRITTVDGEIRHVSAAQRAVVDESNTVRRVIGVNVDLTARREADEELRRNQAIMTQQAEHDFLTDLPNQRALRRRMEQAIALGARNHKYVAILFLDIDGFKHINDSLGHLVGDQLLQSISRRLQGAIRVSDTLSRFGGDEFVVLLPEVNHPEDTTIAATRLLEAVAEVHTVGEQDLHVSACIGISVYPIDGQDGETLIKNADAAMYHAKQSGNSTYRFFESEMSVRAIERQFIEQSLRLAMKRNELSLNYQPKYDLKSRAVTGVEALLRWNHPVRGAISPGTFIPVAEACGLILPIGNWVLEETCRQAREWLDASLPRVSLAVNVSGRQFQAEGFEESVMAILARYGIEPESLELEVTESLLMVTPELTAALLQRLRRRGISVAIDDFGTGYSSLSYLHRFPCDTLKIDQSFVRMVGTPDGLSMVKAIVDIGRNLGMQTVAEGVETQGEERILESVGCHGAQGYFFSRPLTPSKLASLLETREP
jgi:diguanylate cyclase (GGDEF)-like protein/PAS domain S-box-containing protein